MRLKNVPLILALVGLGVALNTQPWKDFFAPEKRFESTWQRDFEVLKKTNFLPDKFSEINEVEYYPLSNQLKTYLEKFKTPDFKINPQGKYKLEIMMDRLDSGGVMIQYDLIDEKGNTIWELGRTFNEKYFP